tara:strand:- start:648 stop:1004 length:357 start_codon:yes stop_codon:yes gene_type:complete
MHYPEIILPLKLMSKARPRVTQRGVYMPKPYQDWRKECAALLRQSWDREPLDHPIGVEIDCYGTARGESTITWVLCSILLTKFSGLMTGLRSFRRRQLRITSARKKRAVGKFVSMTFD